MKKIRSTLLPMVAFLLIALLWYICYEGHLFYWEGATYFQLSGTFFTHCLSQPGGLSLYLGALGSLFYRWPLMGAGIMVLPSILTWGCSLLIFKRLKNKENYQLFVWIPVVMLTIIQFNYTVTLGYALQLAFFFVAVAGYLSLPQWPYRYGLATLLVLLSCLLLSAGGVWMFVFTIGLYELFYTKGKQRFLFLILCITLAALLPIIRQHYWLLIPDDQLYALYSPHLLFGAHHYVIIKFYCFLPLILLINRLAGQVWNRRIFSPLSSIAWLAFFMGFWLTPLNQFTPYEQTLRMNKAIQTGAWSQALAEAERIEKHSNHTLFLTGIALSQTKQLPDRIFDFPFSPASLEPSRDLDYFSNLYTGEFYFRLGIYNEALHRTFQVSVGSPTEIDLYSLRRLIELNIRAGYSEVAQKYMAILYKVPFSGKEIRRYEQMLTETTSYRHSRQFYIGGQRFPQDMASVIDTDTENEMAWQYLLCSLLLERDTKTFARIFPVALRRMQENGRTAPRIYQEAFWELIAFDNDIAPEIKVWIDEKTKKEYSEFCKIAENNSLPVELRKEQLEARFGKTWWFNNRFKQAVLTDIKSSQVY